ncbi:MAG: nitroreductase family protein [Syntrophobacteraceae bacterium]
MKAKYAVRAALVWTFMLVYPLVALAADLSPIQLPAPRMEGGKPLMQTLKDRMTTRTFSEEKLPVQTLSNLLWAAFGINRPDGRRTAPSARNWQEMDVYIATAEGLYVYDAKANVLNPVSARDLRAMTGTQAYVREASISLIYVADYSKVEGGGMDQNVLVGADTGFIAENVYLYCASEGLATVVRASIDRDALAKEMKLKPRQKIILAQSVGYPKK